MSSDDAGSRLLRRLERHQHLLGTIPDHEVAQAADLSTSAVGRYRRSQGIAAYQGYKFGTRRRRNEPTTRPSKLEAFQHLLGRVPDSEVAALAGMTTEGVRIYRKRKGIEARKVRSVADAPEAFLATLVSPDHEELTLVVLATDALEAARIASARCTGQGLVLQDLRYVGASLEAVSWGGAGALSQRGASRAR